MLSHVVKQWAIVRRTMMGLGIVAVASMSSAGSALAQAEANYPSRTITIVVPFPAGGTADLLPRLVAEKVRTMFDQTIIVDNKPGAGGNIGAESVSRATPDGYMLLNAPQLTFSVNHLLNPNLRFDPQALEPVSVLATYPTVLFGRATLPANNLAELIEYARANPDKINYASQGRGQIGHLTIEGIKLQAKIEMTHVPYRGSAPAINDLLGGQVDILADNLLAGLQHVESGKLKLLGVGSKERSAKFPQVPTFAEAVPGFYSDTWMAIAAPAGTPKAITKKLSEAIAKAIQSPDVRKRIEELQAEPFGSTPDQMAALIKESRDRWTPVITTANIKSD
ncbi:MAG: Tripartite-type tricarboxylate transporter, receptor component TctC [Xanthobacteraceae bacterium]|nr:Tripartite-type tricarboxylate transporter, receptor component TctC [Xanthobacteraceae bacterium]